MEPIPLHVLDHHANRDEAQPGDCWRYGDAWWIILPDTSGDVGTPGHPGILSWRTTDRASDPPHLPWDVTGVPPALTVTPSIDILRFVRNPAYDWDKKPEEQPGVPSHFREGSYFHGFITDGMIHL